MISTLLLLLSACEVCGPEILEESAFCPLSTCAETCTDVEEAIACCVAEGGRGLDKWDAASLVETCTGDECDPAAYLSADAARCVAQVHGLSSGVATCAADFMYIPGNAQYYVNNVDRLDCGTAERPASGSGSSRSIHAITGELLSEGHTSFDGECPE